MGVLKALTFGKEIVDVRLREHATIKDLIQNLCEVNEMLCRRVYNKIINDLEADIYIAVNDVDVRLLNQLNTKLKNNDEVLILAYIHGG